MRIDLTIVRAEAIFRYFLNDYPNFDGEIPADAFYLVFKKATSLSMSSFIWFLEEMRLLGVVFKEGKVYSLNEKKLKEVTSKLIDLERKQANDIYARLKKKGETRK